MTMHYTKAELKALEQARKEREANEPAQKK